MVYATADGIRLVSGLTTSDISDADLVSLGVIADKQVIRDISIRVTLEALEGTVDGTNKEFKVAISEICDTDFDSAIGGGDVAVYTMETNDDTGFPEYTSVAVTSVSAINSIVTLTVAPPTTVDGIFINYSYTTPNMDYAQVVQAANYWGAYLALGNLTSANASGDSFRLGKLTVNQAQKVTSMNQRSESTYLMYQQLIKQLRPYEAYEIKGNEMPTFQESGL